MNQDEAYRKLHGMVLATVVMAPDFEKVFDSLPSPAELVDVQSAPDRAALDEEAAKVRKAAFARVVREMCSEYLTTRDAIIEKLEEEAGE